MAHNKPFINLVIIIIIITKQKQLQIAKEILRLDNFLVWGRAYGKRDMRTKILKYHSKNECGLHLWLLQCLTQSMAHSKRGVSANPLWIDQSWKPSKGYWIRQAQKKIQVLNSKTKKNKIMKEQETNTMIIL